MEGVKPVNLILMQNTIQTTDVSHRINKVYDLKGSFNNRIVVKGENQTMKDRNLLACKRTRLRENKKGLLQFDQDDAKEIMGQIRNDVIFMQKMELLDYSLLLAVEGLPNDVSSNVNGTIGISQQSSNKLSQDLSYEKPSLSKDRHRFYSTCGRYVYHVAIIDYLTEFNIQKKMESFYKIRCKGVKEKNLSAVNPVLYGDRFVDFMEKEVIINEEQKRNANLPLTEAIKSASIRQMSKAF